MTGKKRLTVLLLGAFCALALAFGVFSGVTAAADSGESDVEEYGILTKLYVSLDGSGGVVSAIAHNSFTLLPSTVELYVQLYRSRTYQESCSNMECVASNYTADLNMGQSLTASCSTGLEQWYWQGRIYYSFDHQAWKELTTGCYLFDGLGGIIQ